MIYAVIEILKFEVPSRITYISHQVSYDISSESFLFISNAVTLPDD